MSADVAAIVAGEVEQRLAQLEQRGTELVIAYHLAICSPKGVVPDDRFYDPMIAFRVQAALDAGLSVRSSLQQGEGRDG